MRIKNRSNEILEEHLRNGKCEGCGRKVKIFIGFFDSAEEIPSTYKNGHVEIINEAHKDETIQHIFLHGVKHAKGCPLSSDTQDECLQKYKMINIPSIYNISKLKDLDLEDKVSVFENKLKLLNKTLQDCHKINFGKYKGHYLEMLSSYSDTCNVLMYRFLDIEYIESCLDPNIVREEKDYLKWVLINVDFLKAEERVLIRNIINPPKAQSKSKATSSAVQEDYLGMNDWENSVSGYSEMDYGDFC